MIDSWFPTVDQQIKMAGLSRSRRSRLLAGLPHRIRRRRLAGLSTHRWRRRELTDDTTSWTPLNWPTLGPHLTHD